MAIHGKNGNLVYNAGDVVNLQSYTLNRIGETADATAMGDSWDVFNAGLTDFNATAEGLIAAGLDTTALLGTGGDAEFVVNAGGAFFTAGVVVTGITETATIDDNISISYSYEGNDSDGFTFTATGASPPAGSTNTIYGKKIKAEYGAVPTEFTDVTGWSITMSCPTSDSTVADATDHGRQKLAGTNTASATVTILTPDADLPVLEGATVALNLYRSQTNTDGRYEGTAICTGSDTGVDRTGTETTTLNFLYTGVVDLVVTA